MPDLSHLQSTRLALLAFLAAASLPAQTPLKPHLAPKSEAKPDELPITRVALYKNGVGFFEHSGRVTGDQSVTIDFTSAQLNDVLQTLTAIDLAGGRISGAAFNSTTPLEEQLKTLPLGLNSDPSDVDFYNAIRGARVQVTAPGISIAGRLLSIDLRAATKKDDDTAAAEKRFVTVVSESGQVRTLELTAAVSVTLLDTSLHTDVTRYLELLASTRNQGLRHLTLLDRGPEGPAGKATRDLRVSYISEVPVWKSTYRILFTDSPAKPAETATLQGWSVVDNTTGSDWTNVHLDLIAGAPQSFIQPLSTPYYTRRPEIPLPSEAQLAPQTHSSGEDKRRRSGTGIQGTVTDPTGAIIPNAAVVATNTANGAQYSGRTDSEGNYSIDVPDAGQYNVSINSPGFNRTTITNVAVGNDEFADANATINVGSASESVEVSADQIQSLPMMVRSIGGPMKLSQGVVGKAERFSGGGLKSLAPPPPPPPSPSSYQNYATASITPGTTTSSFDDFFEYSLSDPITIRKNESALVPILQTKLPVERVTLWSPSEPVALRALWITNKSDLTLDRGSFSIVENGSFGGEGLLDPIHPNERRLLSYAADQAVRVTPKNTNSVHTVTHLQISKGVLTETSTDLSLLDYSVHNAAPDARTVVVEQPIQNGWTLDATYSNGDPAPKPAETTPTAYRFRVAVSPNATATLHIAQRHTNYQYIQLVQQSEEQLRILLLNTHASPAFLAALQPVFAAHNAVVALDEKINKANTEQNTISADQNRLRENMRALKGSAEERAHITRYTNELNTQEDRLAALRTELAQLHTQRDAADEDFQTKLDAVKLDEDVATAQKQ